MIIPLKKNSINRRNKALYPQNILGNIKANILCEIAYKTIQIIKYQRLEVLLLNVLSI